MPAISFKKLKILSQVYQSRQEFIDHTKLCIGREVVIRDNNGNTKRLRRVCRFICYNVSTIFAITDPYAYYVRFKSGIDINRVVNKRLQSVSHIILPLTGQYTISGQVDIIFCVVAYRNIISRSKLERFATKDS